MEPTQSPTVPVNSPSRLAPFPGSAPIPGRAEAQRIIAEKAVDARVRRERLPNPESARLIPPSAAGTMLPTVAAPVSPPSPMSDEQREAAVRTKKAWDASRVPARYLAADLRKVREDIADVRGESGVTYGQAVEELRRLIGRPGMVAMLGTRGSGKTWMACGLIREFCRAGRFAVYQDAMDYFIRLKATYDDGAKVSQEQVEAEYLRPALLVLDEVHERGDTPWEDRMLTRLINKRYAAELSTVLVGNQTRQTFEERVGPSIFDRLCDGGCILECDWPSLRGRVDR